MQDEQGTISVLAAGIITVLVSIIMAVTAAGALVVAQHKAQVAADMAAIAGAYAISSYVDSSATTPCEVAAHIAAAHEATVESCTVDAADVIIQVKVTTRSAWAQAGPL